MIDILILFFGALGAGFLGALTGLGGGVIIVPLLTLGFGVPMPLAVGASLVSVIGTSSGAASGFVREGYTNMRVGIFLEVATTTGAILGAFVSAYISPNIIGVLFGLILWITIGLNFRHRTDARLPLREGSWAYRLGLYGYFPENGVRVFYSCTRVFGGFFTMLIAGVLSGLLGIGGGALKVLAMENMMRLPFKVSTTTSNFMMGVTAAAGAFIYFLRGEVVAELAAPVLIGVVSGSVLGSRVFMRLPVGLLRRVFLAVIFVVSTYMIYKSIYGQMG